MTSEISSSRDSGAEQEQDSEVQTPGDSLKTSRVMVKLLECSAFSSVSPLDQSCEEGRCVWCSGPRPLLAFRRRGACSSSSTCPLTPCLLDARGLTLFSPAGASVPRVLVGAGLQAVTGENQRQSCCHQSCPPEPRRPEAPAPGHAPAAVHPAPLAPRRPGLPRVQQHRTLPLPW